MVAFQAPPAPPGWLMSWRKSNGDEDGDWVLTRKPTEYHVPHYKREDGWEVVVRGSSDIQIGWTWWPKVRFGALESSVPDSGWGPEAVAGCLAWIERTFPLPRHANGFQGQPWKVEFFMFLHQVVSDRHSPHAREAERLLVTVFGEDERDPPV